MGWDCAAPTASPVTNPTETGLMNPTVSAPSNSSPDYRRKRTSRIPAGNRHSSGGQFAGSGGADRPRLTTTLPVEALDQLDALALEHQLQRNEVLTLALAVLAHPVHGLPEARAQFQELAMAWSGFAAGVQAPAPAAPPEAETAARKPGKVDAAAKSLIQGFLAQGDAAPRGWMTALAKQIGCTTAAVSRVAGKLREAQG